MIFNEEISGLNITGTDMDMGALVNPPQYSYMVRSDTSSDTLSIVEIFNGSELRVIENAKQDFEYILSIPESLFYQIDNDIHTLEIKLSNGVNTVSRVLEFSRDIHRVDVQLVPQVSASKITNVKINAEYSSDYDDDLIITTSSSPYFFKYKRNGETLDLQEGLIGGTPGNITAAALSKDSNYLAVCGSVSPYIAFYKKVNDLFIRIDENASITEKTNYVSWSNDGQYVVFALSVEPYVAIFKQEDSLFIRLKTPSELPTGSSNKCRFSPNGKYLAITHSVSPFVTIYELNHGIFTKTEDPSVLPTSTGQDCIFSNDSDYMMVTHASSPYFTLYKIANNTFTKVVNPSVLPTGTGNSCAFSPDDKYLIIGHTNAPFLTIYSKEGNSLNKVELISSDMMPTSAVYSCSWTQDGKDLILGLSSSPYFLRYKMQNEELIPVGGKIDYPTDTVFGCAYYNDQLVLATSKGMIALSDRDPNYIQISQSANTSVAYNCAFNSSGTHLAVGISSAPYMLTYQVTGDMYALLGNPATLPANSVKGVSYAGTTHLAVAGSGSPYINVYSISGITYTKLANPSTLPTGSANCCAFNSSGTHLVVGHDNSPFVSIYKKSGSTLTKLANPSTIPISSIYSCCWSPDNNYMILRANATSYIYQVSGDTFKYIGPLPGSIAAGQASTITFSPDGMYVAEATYSSPRLNIYKKEDDNFILLPAPDIKPSSNAYGIAFSPDSNTLVVGTSSHPYLLFYKREGDIFNIVHNFNRLPSSRVNISNWSEYSPLKLWSTNNALDSNPVWEKTRNNITHTFENASVENNWALSVRAIVDRPKNGQAELSELVVEYI